MRKYGLWLLALQYARGCFRSSAVFPSIHLKALVMYSNRPGADREKRTSAAVIRLLGSKRSMPASRARASSLAALKTELMGVASMGVNSINAGRADMSCITTPKNARVYGLGEEGGNLSAWMTKAQANARQQLFRLPTKPGHIAASYRPVSFSGGPKFIEDLS